MEFVFDPYKAELKIFFFNWMKKLVYVTNGYSLREREDRKENRDEEVKASHRKTGQHLSDMKKIGQTGQNMQMIQ